MEREELKKLAGEESVKYIKDGMIVGLGTGSTVEYTLKKLGEKVKDGLNIQGIPTSIHTKRIAKEVEIPLTTLDENPENGEAHYYLAVCYKEKEDYNKMLTHLEKAEQLFPKKADRPCVTILSHRSKKRSWNIWDQVLVGCKI